MRVLLPLLAFFASVDSLPVLGQDHNVSIRGTVVDGLTGAAVAGALVELQHLHSTGGSASAQLTGSAGDFVFENIEPSETVSLAASKLGYLTDATANPGRRPEVFAARDRATVKLRLWRPATLVGTIRDEHGAGIPEVTVIALARIRVAGADHFASSTIAMSDELGQFRLSGLTPGSYAVAVPQNLAGRSSSIPNTPVAPPAQANITLGYPLTFAPSSNSVGSALFAEVGFGEVREGVDVTLTAVPTCDVQGVINGSREEVSQLAVRVRAPGNEELGGWADSAKASVSTDGSFRLSGLPLGTYWLDAGSSSSEFRVKSTPLADLKYGVTVLPANRMTNSQDVVGMEGISFVNTTNRLPPTRWAHQELTVERCGGGSIVVDLRTSGTMRGKVSVQDSAPDDRRPDPSKALELEPLGGSTLLGLPRSNTFQHDELRPGEFAIEGLGPGKYFLRIQGGWTIKSITWRGQDYTDTAFDASETSDISNVSVVVTANPGSLTGQVIDGKGGKVVDAQVIVYPKNLSPGDFGMWPRRIRTIRSTDDGAYKFDALPAGDFLVAAFDPNSTVAQIDADVLRRLESDAVRVTVAWGARSQQTVVAVKKLK